MPPIVGAWAQRVYDNLEPLTEQDAALGYPLLTYLGAMGDTFFQDIDDIVRDQSDGTPGWGILLDPTRCPAIALPWLGQLVGVTVDTTADENTQRAQIQAVGGWYRGSPASMLAAAKPYLSGTQFTQLVERVGGDAYQLLYITHSSETPADPTAMQAAVIAQKPAGIILTFANHPGQSYDDVRTYWSTYNDVRTNYSTYNDLRNG